MSKIQKSNKETKKQPALSKKEKKAVKDVKKHSKDAMQPFIAPKE